MVQGNITLDHFLYIMVKRQKNPRNYDLYLVINKYKQLTLYKTFDSVGGEFYTRIDL